MEPLYLPIIINNIWGKKWKFKITSAKLDHEEYVFYGLFFDNNTRYVLRDKLVDFFQVYELLEFN